MLKELFAYTEEYICQYLVDGFDMSQPVKDCFQEYSRRMIQLGRDHRDKILVNEQFLATKKSWKFGKILLSRYGMIGFLT